VIALRRALPVEHDPPCPLAERAPASLVGDEAAERALELCGVPYQDSGVTREQILDRLLETEIVRPEEHRHTENRRLHQIVPALVGAPEEQAAADERDVRGGVELAELADRIHDQHAAASRRDGLAPVDPRLRDGGVAAGLRFG